MSEFQKLTTFGELDVLNSDDVVAGYWAGRNGDPEPGNTHSRSYWHGWRNGMADSGRMRIDEEQCQLAQSVVRKQWAH